LINRRKDVTQGWEFCSLGKGRKERKEKKKLLEIGVFVFSHPAK